MGTEPGTDANEAIAVMKHDINAIKASISRLENTVAEIGKPRPVNVTGLVSSSVAVILLFGTVAGLWINAVITPLRQDVVSNKVAAEQVLAQHRRDIDQVADRSERERTWLYSAMNDRHESSTRSIDVMWLEIFGKKPEPFTPKKGSN